MFMLVPNAFAGTVTRSFDSNTVVAGEEVEVTLTVNLEDTDDKLILTENIPTNFELVDAGMLMTNTPGKLKDAAYNTNRIPSNYVYTLKVPDTPGTYTFTGVYILVGTSTTEIEGTPLTVTSPPLCDETLLDSDVDNCGTCGNSCIALPSQRAICSAGVCGVECVSGLVDCNSDEGDGCECNTGAGYTCESGVCTAPSSCADSDGDGYGNPAHTDCPNTGTDCNDNDATSTPLTVEWCSYPQRVGDKKCSDDNSGYKTCTVTGGCQIWAKTDCDAGNICENSECVEQCLATETSCTDGIDNDCQGGTDCADTQCASHTNCQPGCQSNNDCSGVTPICNAGTEECEACEADTTTHWCLRSGQLVEKENIILDDEFNPLDTNCDTRITISDIALAFNIFKSGGDRGAFYSGGRTDPCE